MVHLDITHNTIHDISPNSSSAFFFIHISFSSFLSIGNVFSLVRRRHLFELGIIALRPALYEYTKQNIPEGLEFLPLLSFQHLALDWLMLKGGRRGMVGRESGCGFQNLMGRQAKNGFLVRVSLTRFLFFLVPFFVPLFILAFPCLSGHPRDLGLGAEGRWADRWMDAYMGHGSGKKAKRKCSVNSCLHLCPLLGWLLGLAWVSCE